VAKVALILPKKNGADFRPRRSCFKPNYFFAFFAGPVGTVAMVCRMRPAIL
jgi:hypothetical protein